MLALSAPARAEPLPPVAQSIKAAETAILLVDFQANFVSPDGAWYGKFAAHYAKTRMLERTVELVKKARAKGALVVHITGATRRTIASSILQIPVPFTAARSTAAPGRSDPRKPHIMRL